MRLFLDGDWYDPIDPRSIYEHTFESLIVQHSSDLFPGYICRRFDPLLASPLGDVRPDLILVDSVYREWRIVEVEMIGHSLLGHVKPQLERISTARPDRAAIEWLCSRNTDIDQARLLDLASRAPHKTQLFVNKSDPDWHISLAGTSVDIGIIEVFRSRLNRTLLRINGTQPPRLGNLLTEVEAGHGWLRNAYRVLTPSALPENRGRLNIQTEDGLTEWTIKAFGVDVFMLPRNSRMPRWLLGALILNQDGTLRMEGTR